MQQHCQSMLKKEHVGVAGSGTTTAMSLLVQTWHEARSLDLVCPWHIFHSGERVHAFCGITHGQGSTMLPCQDTGQTFRTSNRRTCAPWSHRAPWNRKNTTPVGKSRPEGICTDFLFFRKRERRFTAVYSRIRTQAKGRDPHREA